MTTPEGKIEDYLVKRVRETGGFTRKLKWIGHNGAPDRMVWWNTPEQQRVYFIELKAPGEAATSQQKSEHRKMRESGLSVFVFDSKKHIDDLVKPHT